MDRRSEHRSPEAEDEAVPQDAAADPLDRILPPIDEDDPAWQAYAREKIRESLDDPRPDIPAEEVFAELRARHEARVKRGA